MHRYRVTYGDNGGYAVRDRHTRRYPTVFKSSSKIECIRKAQELNGFTPADWDEQTYGKQIADATRRVGR